MQDFLENRTWKNYLRNGKASCRDGYGASERCSTTSWINNTGVHVDKRYNATALIG